MMKMELIENADDLWLVRVTDTKGNSTDYKVYKKDDHVVPLAKAALKSKLIKFAKEMID